MAIRQRWAIISIGVPGLMEVEGLFSWGSAEEIMQPLIDMGILDHRWAETVARLPSLRPSQSPVHLSISESREPRDMWAVSGTP
jgi:hypothetical protein